jgi:hypothetical protein
MYAIGELGSVEPTPLCHILSESWLFLHYKFGIGLVLVGSTRSPCWFGMASMESTAKTSLLVVVSRKLVYVCWCSVYNVWCMHSEGG